MKFQELKNILTRIFKEYIRKHLKKIFLALILSLIVAASTSGIAWLLDPAVKKIFIEHQTCVIPVVNKNMVLSNILTLENFLKNYL